jgi:serine-type D-Ala-D-Ala carboxypeptidase (penicillin-binding protein 5/6)
MSQPSRFLPSSGVSARRHARRRARARRRAIAALLVVGAAVAVLVANSSGHLSLGFLHAASPAAGAGAISPPAAVRLASGSGSTGAASGAGSGVAVDAEPSTAAPAQAAAAAASLGAPGATQLALTDGNAVGPPFKAKPGAGILFDIDTGRVLWQLNATEVMPIASLTKMMTALLVVRNAPADARVLITKQAIDYQGSGVGELPYHRHVRLESLLYGLLLPSGNDAAIALAQHISRTLPRFVALMNATARQLGLGCTHYVSPDGIENANVSCPADLARLARIVLAQPRLAKIVGSASAIIPFPIKGHKLYLYNSNPLLRSGFPGITGMKTGETDAAGLCLVATAQRGSVRIGSVLLHARDPAALARQSATLLTAGFAAEHG